MRIEECDMCGHPIYPGHGMTFVRNDASVFHFCKKKCRIAFHKRANPRRLRYTKAYRKTHGKELSIDTTFEFEKRRDRPLKYDRELYAATIKAMKKVNSIQYARQKAFYNERMKKALKMRKHRLTTITAKHADLLVAPIALQAKNKMEITNTEETNKDVIKLQNDIVQPIKATKKTNQIESDDDDDMSDDE